jgi:hypothetical protein
MLGWWTLGQHCGCRWCPSRSKGKPSLTRCRWFPTRSNQEQGITRTVNLARQVVVDHQFETDVPKICANYQCHLCFPLFSKMSQLDFHPTFITALEGVSQVHELIKLKARCATTTRVFPCTLKSAYIGMKTSDKRDNFIYWSDFVHFWIWWSCFPKP